MVLKVRARHEGKVVHHLTAHAPRLPAHISINVVPMAQAKGVNNRVHSFVSVIGCGTMRVWCVARARGTHRGTSES